MLKAIEVYILCETGEVPWIRTKRGFSKAIKKRVPRSEGLLTRHNLIIPKTKRSVVADKIKAGVR